MSLVYKVICQDHVIKGSGGHINGSPSRYVTILASLVAIDTLVIEIYGFLFVM